LYINIGAVSYPHGLPDTHKFRFSHLWLNPSPIMFYLLIYNAAYSVETQPAFQRKLLPPSSGLKSKSSKKPE
jgi:hypothetical protein